MNRFAPERLHEFCRRVFESFGISPADADQAADILIVADLRGIDTHGVARMKSLRRPDGSRAASTRVPIFASSATARRGDASTATTAWA